jgi:hypothetical protein
MRHADQRRPHVGTAPNLPPLFAPGDRVLVVGAPASYGYNGRTGTVVTVDGPQIHVRVDQPPGDMSCTTFYPEELALAPGTPADDRGGQP